MEHRGAAQILLQYDYSDRLNKVVRHIKSVKWSQTLKGWYLPLTEDNYLAIQQAVAGLAQLDTSLLRKYLQERKDKAAAKPAKAVNTTVTAATLATTIAAGSVVVTEQQPMPKAGPAYNIAFINEQALQKMMDLLTLKAYSASTMRTYRGEMMVFLQVPGKHAAEALSTADVKRYLLKCIGDGLRENTVHSRINALKFFYEQVLGREKFFVEIPRPKKQLQLPPFFSQQDIATIIRDTVNIKHKTMLMLAYSAGLRVSEVVSIKVWQIDSGRMQILIQQAKGKKDRIVPLSAVLLVMLREYFKMYKPDRKGYLFTGDQAGEHYHERSLQKVLQQAKERAGILKPGSTHALRHSFATHLLDKGTDVTMIMKLLGHNDLKTTLRYLHVTNRDVLKLVSPLDDLQI